jgi:hypothetical protein
MEDLGDLCGLDYDTAYFMKYGKNPPYRQKFCIYTPPEFDWERVNEPDDYICWRGARIGDSIQALAY